MPSFTAQVIETPDGPVIALPRDVQLPSSVRQVTVSYGSSEPRRFASGAEIARALMELPGPGVVGERLPVDIPDRG